MALRPAALSFLSGLCVSAGSPRRFGPAEWKCKHWEGVVYPQPAPRGFDPLAYIAEYFTTVEINSSYYGPPQPATARRWVNSVSHNRDFRFTAQV
jgi:uncharacterized protein YecE (DUF72 family)